MSTGIGAQIVMFAMQSAYLDSRPTQDREERDIRTAKRLGYHLYPETTDIRELVLPVNPFTYVRPFVIVRELILDANGCSIQGGDRKAVRIKVRWLP